MPPYSGASAAQDQANRGLGGGKVDTAAFVKAATAATYGDGSSLADQVGRRKFYSDNKSGFAR